MGWRAARVMTSADPAFQLSELELFLVTVAAFVLGTASVSPCALGGKDFAGMDGGYMLARMR